jgi:hypothetical protein
MFRGSVITCSIKSPVFPTVPRKIHVPWRAAHLRFVTIFEDKALYFPAGEKYKCTGMMPGFDSLVELIYNLGLLLAEAVVECPLHSDAVRFGHSFSP